MPLLRHALPPQGGRSSERTLSEAKLKSLSFKAASWLPGGHAQTIYPALLAPRPKVQLRRERWTTPDGDFIDVDFTENIEFSANSKSPVLVLFHGLEGSSASHYCQTTMQACLDRGWQGVVPHFRGCSGEINLAPRTYHSGETSDVDWILKVLAQRFPSQSRYAVGVSLGGNALLKWLGEQGSQASNIVAAAAAFCPPQDLAAGALALSKGFNLLYMRNFLKTLTGKALAKSEQYPGLMNREHILASRNFFDFDEVVTAKLHGFASCNDYWQQCSSKFFLSGIATPTLIVNARNDPFLPPQTLASTKDASASVKLYYPEHGGHVGFLQGAFPGNMHWLPNTAMQFFDHG